MWSNTDKSTQQQDDDKYEKEQKVEGAESLEESSHHLRTVESLKGNFDQQQALIGKLKDMLKNKESSGQKERDLEDYATRLAKMKPRLIRGRGRGRGRMRDEGSTHRQLIQPTSHVVPQCQEQSSSSFQEAVSVPSQNVAHESKEAAVPGQSPETKDIDLSSSEMDVPVLLRETSASVLPPTEEIADSSSVETAKPLASLPSTTEKGSRSKILLLRKQLEENRIKFERQQRENADKRATMDDMSERIEKLRMEVEQRDAVIHSLKDIDSMQTSDPNIQHLYQQILHKDNSVLELSDEVIQLETTIRDQQEQLNEKDQIISARTEAVSLITKDKDEKILQATQTLEDLRQEMKELQKNFVHKEEKWKEKENSFENMIADKNKKILVLEENCHRIDSIRFELSARNAELQEKVVSQQCDAKDIKKEYNELKIVLEKSSDELSEVQKKLVRAESFGQKKLKSLEKQIKSISNDSDLGDKILELQNQLAELEEEKGNFQLKLVDFDEIISQNEKLKESFKKSELKIEQLNSEILSHIALVSQIETEKITLVEELNSKSLQVNELEESASYYTKQYEALKQCNVTLELKLCEIEEERDIALKNQKDLEKEQRKAESLELTEANKDEIKNLEEKNNNLLLELDEKNKKMVDLKQKMLENNDTMKLCIEEKEEKISENECLISFLAEKENLISSQSIKLEKHDVIVQNLNEQISSKENGIISLSTQSNSLCSEIDSLKQRLNDNELHISHLNHEIGKLQEEIGSNRKSISILKDSENSLKLVVSEKESVIKNMDAEIVSLKEEIQAKDSNLTEQIKRIENIDSLLQSREKQILNLESEIADKLRDNSQESLKSSKLEAEIENLNKYYHETKSKLEAECDMISCLISDKDNNIKVLEEQLNIKDTQLNNSEIMVSRYEEEVCEKNKLYDNLIIEKTNHEIRVAELESQINEIFSNNERNILKIKTDNGQESLKSSKLEAEIENLNKSYHETKSKLEAECNMISCLISEKDNNIKVLEEQLNIKDTQLNNSEIMVSRYEEEVCEKNKLYDNLLIEKTNHETRVAELESQINEIFSNNERNVLKIKNLEELLIEKEEHIRHLSESSKHQGELYSVLGTQKQQFEDEFSILKSQFEAKEAEYQRIQGEYSSIYEAKEQEVLQIYTVLAEKDTEIQNLKEPISSISNEDLENKLQQITELECLMSTKANELEQSKSLIQTNNEALSQKDEELHSLKIDLVFYKRQCEDITEKLESTKLEQEKEIQCFKDEIEAKNTTIIYYQNNVDVESAKTVEIENYKMCLQQLKDKLNKKSNELQETRDHLESLLQERESKFNSLQDEFNICKTALDEKVQDYLKLQENCLTLESNIKLYEEKINNLNSQQSLEETSFIAIKEAEISSLRYELEEQKSLCAKLTSENDNLSQRIVINEEVQEKTSNEAFYASLQSNVNEENLSLKKQLEEAQQAIIRLETCLATQASTSEVLPQESSEEWGVVDLGERYVAEPSLLMQTSLWEKDKALTVIQEQLKIALEELNTINDEKKIMKHQMNTMEAALSHKDEKISIFHERIRELEANVNSLNIHLSERNVISSTTDEVVYTETRSDGIGVIAIHPPLPIESKDLIPDSATLETPEAFFDNIEAHNTGNVETGPEAQVNVEPDKHPQPSLEELQYNLSWYEENWASWTEHYNQLQLSYQNAEQQIGLLNQELASLRNSRAANLQNTPESLEQAIEVLNEEKRALEQNIEESNKTNLAESEKRRGQIEECNQEISRLKGFETQVYELQGHVQTLQHQCSVLETKVADVERNSSKIHEYEMLYGELQTSMQEAETKREGSKSRVQELELMVQSAESEIERLRADLQKLSKAGDALEKERDSFQRELENLKEEVRKCVAERERFEQANDRLQSEAAQLHSQSIELQSRSERNESEINQLRSEIEILEGENERNRSNMEILESELNNQRLEAETLTQNNQIAVAERESIDHEMQRILNSYSALIYERDSFRNEIQRISEVNVSAETEITRLKTEIHKINIENSRLQNKYVELEQLKDTRQATNILESSQEFSLEEVDWKAEGRFEDEHIQRSSSLEISLRDEIGELKSNVIKLEKEKQEIDNELQSTKLKNGKLIQKLKAANNKNENLLKDMAKMKTKAGGFSDLDSALEDEWKSQMAKAESERDELKIKLAEAEKEKIQIKNHADVLESAHERYIEMKESQDASFRQLTSRNKNLESQISALEWKVSELEENVEQQQFSQSNNTVAESEGVENIIVGLNVNIAALEKEVNELKSENTEIRNKNEELKQKFDKLMNEYSELNSLLDDLRDAKSKSETNTNTYKTSFLELYTEQETLQENYDKIAKELEVIKSEQMTLNAAYDVLYGEYHDLQDNRDSVRLELGIMVGERDKLVEETKSLNNQLSALQEEEEVDIIKALQDECADQREQNNDLKDELTRVMETLRQTEENVERTKNSLDQQVEIQDMLRMELVSKTMQGNNMTSTINKQEQELKYLNAEVSSLKTKCAQLQQALEEVEPEVERLKEQLANVQSKNEQLIKQVEIADVSLMEVATRQKAEALERRDSFSREESEMELAATLSSLHLRDLRCQQLSLEINKLLEERDGLQLKLSSALRQNQEMTRALTRELTISQQIPSPLTSPPSLNQKLTELRDLNSGLEQKVLDSLKSSNFSANLSTLPPTFPTFASHTAPATPTATRQANYVVMRESQGSSSTLMNWFMGKSTPKEVLHV